MRVYLGGTISPHPSHLNWRKLASDVLHDHGITSVDPIRFQSPSNFSEDGLADSTVPASFMTNVDLADVRSCDALLIVYWAPRNGSTARKSVGTWVEFGVASHLHKPIFVVTDDPAVRDHPFVRTLAAQVFDRVEPALNAILRLRLQ